VAIDGETQLAARHEARNLNEETMQEFVPIYVCHGRDKQWARQSFHDLNALGVKPNAALSIGMDARERLMQDRPFHLATSLDLLCNLPDVDDTPVFRGGSELTGLPSAGLHELRKALLAGEKLVH